METEAPAIDTSLNWIWRAWQRLNDDRPYYGGGMGPAVPGRIPWSLVQLWGQHHNLARGELNMLDTCFAAMDAAYIQNWQEKQQTEKP